MTSRCLITLIDAISLADGTRSIRSLLDDTRLPPYTLVVEESVVFEVLLEFNTMEDVKIIIEKLRGYSK